MLLYAVYHMSDRRGFLVVLRLDIVSSMINHQPQFRNGLGLFRCKPLPFINNKIKNHGSENLHNQREKNHQDRIYI